LFYLIFFNKIKLGSSNFGYPDEDYFRRVKEEIALRGVTSDGLTENPIQIGKKIVEEGKGKQLRNRF